MSTAQDPAHAWDWVSVPYTDYAAKALAEDQRAYYEKYDTDKDKPMLRTEVWRVKLRDQ